MVRRHPSNQRVIDEDQRELLFRRHFGLVWYAARRLARRIAMPCDLDELVSAGSIGLLRALETFDHSRGYAFSTFAMPRIRGAMLDELRRLDHVPRSVRRKARAIGEGRERLANALGRKPTDADLAAHLGLDLRTLWRWEAAIEQSVSLTIDGFGARDDSPALIDWLLVHSAAAIDDELTHAEEVRIARAALGELREVERAVVTQFYFEERSLGEIAATLGITDVRVCQIRAKALATLRAALRHLREEAA